MLVFLALFGLISGIGIVALGMELAQRLALTHVDRVIRQQRFARRNGLNPLDRGTASGRHPGVIFSDADAPFSTYGALSSPVAPRVEFGTVRVGRDSENDSPTNYGYCVFQLNKHVPHILAQGLIGGRAMPLPVLFGNRQRLSLEGSFHRHFLLHVPAGYERDALYLLTPDVMVAFIDFADGLSVELVDDKLIVFFIGALDQRLLRAAQAIGDEISHQARLYRDDRNVVVGDGELVPDTGRVPRWSASHRISEAGRPLNTKGNWTTAAIGFGVTLLACALALLGQLDS